ncbi:unnamed protein product [Penicillium salamii]|uniref:Uncharacterized protein n=1 Tax=Penicillium salamii TaxID=1612424 RepID=A0A9W4IEF9_9EURO|nr:unnamed protein product [Penicillium salamii]CAG8235568.1 unnamed protein product [Penicillium salamii]CAG8252502.1 unnamed protein product [Penicillium salamii]CAG8264114.1 unnamed protein product [Penicillium salamii]CAG8350556.1 unnamed protein product [Penicillium salamii]
MSDTINVEELNTKMQAVLDAFEAHPECSPPNTNPTIYFVYDFIRNTYNQLKQIDAAKYAAGDNATDAAVREIVGRNAFASVLINDTSGKMAMMTGGDPSAPTNFGDDIKATVATL